MTTLVLGASGFIGSWVVRALLHRMTDTTVLVRPESDLWRLGALSPTIIRAGEPDWADAISALKPEVIVSLDWTGVGGSHRDEESQWHNLRRSEAVLAAAAAVGTRRFVGVGSQAEYGPKAEVISENLTPAPTTAYGQAKLAAMHSSREFCDQHGIEWIWARVFSVFGPLDNGHWLLPLIADALLTGEDIELTEGEQLWSYLFAADAGTAFATLATHPEAAGIFNVGDPSAPRLRETIETFAGHFSSNARLLFGARSLGENPVLRLEPDMSRLNALGWEPSVGLAEGLRDTARWLSGEPVADPLSPGVVLPPRVR